MPVLPSKVYDVLKWLVITVIPACTTFYVVCAGIWGWPMADAIAKTSAALCILIGTIIGISQIGYNKTIATSKTEVENAAAKEEKT